MNCSYIVNIFNNKNQLIYVKVGATNNLLRRLKELKKAYPQAEKIELLRIYTVSTKDLATALESLIKNFLKNQGYQSIIQDRFKPFILTKKESEQIQKIYETVLTMF